MVGKPSQNPENFIQQADTIGNSTIYTYLEIWFGWKCSKARCFQLAACDIAATVQPFYFICGA